MYSRLFIIALFGLTVFFQGCHTLKGVQKGVKEGIKEDWKDLNKVDGWIKENLW